MGMRRQFSRREILAGIGLAGAGATACACSGGALLTLWWLNTSSVTTESLLPPSQPASTARPRFAKPPIVSRAAWGALPPDHGARNENGFYSEENIEGWRVYDGNIQDAYQTVIVHHAAFYEGDDLATLREIQRVHRNDRGWADVAYHFMVGQNGLIYEGRDLQVRGTHVASYNTGSIGICLLGNFMTQSPTAAQLNSTLSLIKWVSEEAALTHIASHREFNSQTLCPGDNLHVYMEQFITASGLRFGSGGYIAPDDAAACICCDCHTII